MEPAPPPDDLDAQAAAVAQRRRAQRRMASICFFAAGVGFGTAIYLLRARFTLLLLPAKRAGFVALVALMVLLFWLGARAEAEIGRLDERLRELRDAAAARRRRVSE
jgi:hypothetical protein